MYLCSKCKNLKPKSAFPPDLRNVLRGQTSSWCRKCRQAAQPAKRRRFRDRHGISYNLHRRQKTLSAYFSHTVWNVRHRAKVKGWPCELNTRTLVALWEKQKGICAISGITMTHIAGQGVLPYNVSVDRIDSTKGYTLQNTQLVCNVVNWVKLNLSQPHFIDLCKAIAEKNR